MSHEPTEIQQLSFEAAMERLEQIVEQLENGDVPLEQAIELFQEGMLLSKSCNTKLSQVERKIEMLTEENGEWIQAPFQVEAGDQGE
ncbi:MAG: exodeoxyribonuclease VII small subunit [Paenibacillus sp.]|uniref:Exodeoxyribonuclease 7 small subunit n=1 Tax=Paenibacillus aquistagni TaxID=1852522 RepID=A0A1X7JJG9_9BACL|nr:exodeoxyribonuclease VII small subunit [Paenibacillus aquistagni]MBR2567950.1 exodeoxyribonuclease VII small subunit [Paenibacillus sp.]NMM54501.1 exodeoxyribonuclease VII small subunit [Paenibacillus aquistagni]SMG27892.1 Exodeoxyribonuclease VII small subunit [Paenibacillus aquistagni]